MQREVIRLECDVPVICKLDFGPEGIQTEAKSGAVQYQYTVNDNTGVMWLFPEARQALLKSGAKPGDSVQLVKSLRGKTPIYHAQVVSSEPPLAPAPRTPNVTEQLRTGNGKIPQRAYYQPPPQVYETGDPEADETAAINRQEIAKRQQAALAQHITRESKPEPAPAPPPPAVREVHPVTEQLTSCLKSAIDAAAAAQEHARERGLGVTFTSEDVRAIALSVYIGLQRSRNEVR